MTIESRGNSSTIKEDVVIRGKVNTKLLRKRSLENSRFGSKHNNLK